MRAIRTSDWLYIRNFRPERWPSGDPPVFGEVDYSPTKDFMLRYKDRPDVRPLYDLAFAKRPEEELYAVSDGYANLHNKAQDDCLSEIKESLWLRLRSRLEGTRDPRIQGGGDVFDHYPHTQLLGKDYSQEQYHSTRELREHGLIE